MNFHELMGRIYGLAIIDIVGTIVIVYLLSIYMKWTTWDFLGILAYAFILGEVVHYALGIETPIIRHLAGV